MLQISQIGEAYGKGKSKYAAAFRQMNGLSEKCNVATFKLVPKEFYDAKGGSLKGAKSEEKAQYLTMASAGSIVLPSGAKSAAKHSEQNIIVELKDQGEETDMETGITSKAANYRDLSFEKFWVAWVYTERSPCHADNYELLEKGPDFQCYYSFFGQQCSAKIAAALPKSAVPLSGNGGKNTKLSLQVAEDASSF